MNVSKYEAREAASVALGVMAGTGLALSLGSSYGMAEILIQMALMGLLSVAAWVAIASWVTTGNTIVRGTVMLVTTVVITLLALIFLYLLAD